MILLLEMHGSVVVSTSALHSSEFKTRTGQGMFGVKTWLSTLGLCIPRDSDDHINVGPVSLNWGRKRTIEDDVHPGSDHPQCQHKKVGLAMMFCKRLAS